MKTKTIQKKLGHFRNFQGSKNSFIFQSRFNDSKYVKVFDQNGNAVALPIIIDKEGFEWVSFHAKTVKSIIEFLESK